MTAEQHSSPATTLTLHSQLTLPARAIRKPLLASVESYESLWNRVNRICDRYIQPQNRAAQDSSASQTIS
jgi:hypothetical protein